MSDLLKVASNQLLLIGTLIPAVTGAVWLVCLAWAHVFEPGGLAFLMAVILTCSLIAGLVLRVIWWWRKLVPEDSIEGKDRIIVKTLWLSQLAAFATALGILAVIGWCV